MAAIRRSLTIYRFRETIEGKEIESFDDVITNPDELSSYDLVDTYNFEARLYVSPSKEKMPPWVEFLEDGFGEIAEISESIINSAVLIARVKYYKDYYFSIPFGYGRYLLKKNSFQRNYGLRVALNTIYQSIDTNGELDPTRVRSVDAKTVSANTLYTRRQSTRKATFETFGIDIQSDLLKAVTGYPVKSDLWGTRITGADALNVSLNIEFKDLGDVLKQIEKTYRKDDYTNNFAWIDNIHVVTNLELLNDLENHLLEIIKSKDVASTEIAPPELIAWDEVAWFRFNIGSEEEHNELNIQDYLDILEVENELNELSIKQLRQSHKVEAYDSDGNIIARWSVYNCLDAEFEFAGKTYLLNGGDFYEVAENYLVEINRYIQALNESDKDLPVSVGDLSEGLYNELAANSSQNYLLLDKRTVRISTHTSPIEICDVLTHDNHFIHIKRKLGSSSLSHLFSQGFVSSELFLMSQEYRSKMLLQIQAAEVDRAEKEGDESYIRRFSAFDAARISPYDYEVVYAVIANWKGRDFVEALPFFSKVNLRRFTEDLHQMGFKVSYKKVQIT